MASELRNLDRTGRQILQILQSEARLPFSQVGVRVGLSGPAVAERVRQMQENGLIEGYQAVIAPDKAGFSIQAFIRLRTAPEHYPHLLELLENLPEVLECCHVTGEDAFILRVVARSTTALEQVIARLSPYGETFTSVVLSTSFRRGLRWEE